MIYNISVPIKEKSLGMWQEGHSYEKTSLYKINHEKLPPVNYDKHHLCSHSITHMEAPKHVLENGHTVDHFFSDSSYFYGECVVIRLQKNKYKKVIGSNNLYLWEITKIDLVENLSRVLKSHPLPPKVLITSSFYPTNEDGYHDPNYVLILSLDAAQYLVDHPQFNTYGTSWKSSDFQPNSAERPIHKKLFEKGIIYELLNLKNVPEGLYDFYGAPINIVGASESPVSPILISRK